MITLKKNPERDFVVLNLTDPQLVGSDWIEKSNNWKILTYTVDELVKRTSPDLITVSGDISYSNDFDSYESFASLLDSYKIPWAIAWGNHDGQGGPESLEKQADIILKHEYCRYEKGDPSLGNGNYIIAIEENGNIIYSLVMFDSHDGMEYVNPDGKVTREWAHLLPEQLEWYKQEIEKIGSPRNTIIMHIPFYTYRDAFDAAWNKEYKPEEVTPQESYDPKYWNEGYKDSYGVMYEGVGSYPADLGEFEFVRKVGLTDNVIVGHEHVNNYVINYKGIKLVYSLKTGPGCYWNKILNGGTVLRISSSGTNLEHVFVDVNHLA